MIIGFDASRAFVKNRTGTENYSYQLLKNLSLIDTENEYYVYIRESQKSKIKSQNWPPNFKFKILNFKLLWTQLGLAIRTFTDPLDVLFVPAHTIPLIRNPKLKTVMTVHDLGAEFLPSLHQLKQQLYLKLITDYQLKTTTKLIAVSEATKKDLMANVGIPEKKVSVIYEGVGEKRQASSVKRQGKRVDTEVDVLRKFDVEKEGYFLFIGTVQPRKNLERVIRAFKGFINVAGSVKRKAGSNQEYSFNNNFYSSSEVEKYKNFKLVIAGGKGWKSEAIYDLPKQLGIEKKVIFTGRISEEDKEYLYQNATALTFPSLFEGFGLPILEAFSNGCPVITSNSSSMPEVAGNGAILVNPLSVSDILDAMITLVNNKAKRLELIRNGREQLKKFSWEKTSRETLEILKSIRRG